MSAATIASTYRVGVGTPVHVDSVVPRRALITEAIESGGITPQPVEVAALTMLGALREATLYI
jgi:hypothetical protein